MLGRSPAITAFTRFNGDAPTHRTELKLLTDGRKLFLGFTLHDDHIDTMAFNPVASPFANDCVELYFDPRHDGTRSIQVAVDGAAHVWQQKRFDDGYGWWDDASWSILADYKAAVRKHDKDWSLEIEIDCPNFGIDPSPGKVCGFNPCRFCWGRDSELLSWGHGTDVQPQKHIPSWGHLIFGVEGQKLKDAPLTREDIKLIYPDLGGRVLRIPMDGGFTLVTRDSEKRANFAELLQSQLDDFKKALEQAGGELTKLGDAHRLSASRKQDYAVLAKEYQSVAAAFVGNRERLTESSYVKMADRLTKAREEADDLFWKIKAAGLL